MNFIGKIRQNEKAVFLGKVIFFYLLLMILWMHFMLQRILQHRRLFMSSFKLYRFGMRYITYGYILK